MGIAITIFHSQQTERIEKHVLAEKKRIRSTPFDYIFDNKYRIINYKKGLYSVSFPGNFFVRLFAEREELSVLLTTSRRPQEQNDH